MQAICVTPIENSNSGRQPENEKYEIIYGHRRDYAAKSAGMKEILCKIKTNLKPKDTVRLAIIENTQRKDLNPIETAKMYKKMIQELKYSQQEIAEIVGKDRTRIAHTIKLLELPKEVQEGVRRRTILPGHAEVLLKLPTEELQVTAYHYVVSKNLSVREIEELVKEMMKFKKEDESEKLPNIDYFAVAHKLSLLLGIPVSVREFKKTELKIHFKNFKDLMFMIKKFSEINLKEFSDLELLRQKYISGIFARL